MRRIEVLLVANGRQPFKEWLESLDARVESQVLNFVRRLAAGGAKNNVKALGEGVFEIRIDSGPGYRIYFGEVKKEIIYLISGGTKRHQDRDIRAAKEYWRAYAPK